MSELDKMLGARYTYHIRKVGRFEEGDLTIDTCKVTDDKNFPYETAVSHPYYNNGEWVVAEQYKTKEEAQEGHNKWIKIFKAGFPNAIPKKAVGFLKLIKDDTTIKKEEK